MKNTFEINGKEYEAKPFTFNMICELEDMGFSIEDMDRKALSMIRAYFALCIGDVVTAGNEIEAHIIGGGDLAGISEAIGKELNESGFFKAMVAQTQEKEKKAQKKATKSKDE